MITATVPLAELFGYASRLRGRTQGRAPSPPGRPVWRRYRPRSRVPCRPGDPAARRAVAACPPPTSGRGGLAPPLVGSRSR
ncbi:hypothetical protein WKI68_43135 [Streptomyces sp. MS1.HAVA.3]|uniref:Uncharacterized protein n=1 Tax=Streptomyces caledonius TaxID=3134107 RepID=A0ABU8UE88_9ACTN